jgi:hypothetical protein
MMQQHHTFRKFGVKDEQDVFHQVPILLHVISFCVVGPNRKYTDQNQEHLTNWDNKFEILLPLFLLTS